MRDFVINIIISLLIAIACFVALKKLAYIPDTAMSISKSGYDSKKIISRMKYHVILVAHRGGGGKWYFIRDGIRCEL